MTSENSIKELVAIAERQREACAVFVGQFLGETIRTNIMADIRATPLVTDTSEFALKSMTVLEFMKTAYKSK